MTSTGKYAGTAQLLFLVYINALMDLDSWWHYMMQDNEQL